MFDDQALYSYHHLQRAFHADHDLLADHPNTLLPGLLGGIFAQAANSLMVLAEVRLLRKTNGVFTCDYIAGEFWDYW